MPAPLLLHVFSTFAVGGAQVRFTTIANHLGPSFRHAIVAMDNNHAARERLDPGLDVTFPPITLPKTGLHRIIPAIRHALREWQPARLITHNWGSIEWALANRLQIVPHVHVEDGFGPEERTRQIPRRVYTRRIALAGRTLVVPSQTLRRIALETWRLNPARIRYIPNGIDLTRFAPNPAPSTNPTLTIGIVAALRAEKNLARLLRAFALATQDTPPARLLIIGDGPDRPSLQALAQQLGIAPQIHWAGHIPEPSALIRTFDIFALSSDTEQMPISLLEAMAAALPVASTDVGDVATMLPPEQRDLIVPLDDAALAQALARLLREEPLRQTLGAANRARAIAQFDETAMFATWSALWSGLNT